MARRSSSWDRGRHGKQSQRAGLERCSESGEFQLLRELQPAEFDNRSCDRCRFSSGYERAARRAGKIAAPHASIAPASAISSSPRTLPPNLDGLRGVIDCANGAGYKVAPETLWELGPEVVKIGVVGAVRRRAQILEWRKRGDGACKRRGSSQPSQGHVERQPRRWRTRDEDGLRVYRVLPNSCLPRCSAPCRPCWSIDRVTTK